MTIQEMRDKKKEMGYTYAQIADLSGVPLGTVQKIFSGETESPRYDTILALEQLFRDSTVVREGSSYKSGSRYERNGSYTLDDYYALPDEQRVELIDGYFFDMYSPTFGHQSIGGEIHRQIANYIMEHGGSCRPFIAPVDVQLDCDDRTMVQPDVGIVCAPDKIKRFGIYGAPDFLVEVTSPSTKKKDFTLKLFKYMEAGVREYWILDFTQRRILVYYFESDVYPVIYGFAQPVPVNIYNGELKIDFSNIAKWLDEGME